MLKKWEKLNQIDGKNQIVWIPMFIPYLARGDYTASQTPTLKIVFSKGTLLRKPFLSL